MIDEAGLARLARTRTPVTRFATEIFDSYLDFYQHEWGRRICPLHDPLAAAVLLDRSFVTGAVDGPVDVVTNGYSWRARLMRTSDGEPGVLPVRPVPDAHVITAVDAGRFVADFLAVLTA